MQVQQDIQFENGEIMSGKEISKLIEFIVNKLAEEGLNYEEAKFILEKTEIAIKGSCFIRPVD